MIKQLFLTTILSLFFCACTKVEHKVFGKGFTPPPSTVEVIEIKNSNLTKNLESVGTLESPQ